MIAPGIHKILYTKADTYSLTIPPLLRYVVRTPRAVLEDYQDYRLVDSEDYRIVDQLQSIPVAPSSSVPCKHALVLPVYN